MYLDLINSASDVAFRLHEMANKNLEELTGNTQGRDEVQDYYLGMLRRQAILTFDLSKILHNRPAENVTTPYILLRTLMDDFIHLLYLEKVESREIEIIKINAEGHRDNFNSLKNLTASQNQTYFNESFGYLSEDEFEHLKLTFKENPQNQKYFENLGLFKFKKPLSLTEMANSINSSENFNVARDRSFYMWKTFSSFIHYSNWCFSYESSGHIENIQIIEEALQYTFNTIYIAAFYFKTSKGTNCRVDKYLLEVLKFPILQLNNN